MTKLKADQTVDFQMFDNGQALATLTIVDAKGIPTVMPPGSQGIAWSSSDPAIVVSPSEDQMSAILTPVDPPVLAQNVVITAQSTLPDTTVITGTTQPIDVVAGGPAGFKITLS